MQSLFFSSQISWLLIQRLYGLDQNFARIKTNHPSLIQNALQPSTSTTQNNNDIDDHDYSLQRHSTSSAENIANFDVPHSSQSTNFIIKTMQEDFKDQIVEKMVNKSKIIFHYVFYSGKFSEWKCLFLPMLLSNFWPLFGLGQSFAIAGGR